MSTANPEIYGATTDYILAPCLIHRDSSSVNTQTGAFEFPKSPNFGGATGDDVAELRRAIAQDKIPLNTPIDLSICDVGQDNKVSAFGSFAVWRVDHDENNPRPTLDKRITINNNINTYFYTAFYGDNTLPNLHTLSARTNFDAGRYQRWSPDAAYIVGSSSLYNPNMLIYPIVTKGAKSIIGCVWVGLYDNQHHGSGVTWVRLDEWKTTYNTRKIAAIGMSLHTPYTTQGEGSAKTITYTDITDNNSYGSYQRVSAGILNPIDGRYDYSFNISRGFEAFGQSFIYFLDRYNFDNSTELCPEDMRVYMPCEGIFDDNSVKYAWEKRVSGGDRIYIYRYISYNEANYEAIMKMAACFGIPFITKNISLTFNMESGWNNEDLYFPVIDDNGICHGEYTHGAGNLTNPFNDLANTREKNYNPTADIDPNTYSVTTGFNTVGNVASTTKAYVINSNGIQGLSSELWTIIDNLIVNPSDVENLYNLSLDTFLTNNPIDAIVSVKKFPLSSVPHGENLENVYLGKVQTGAAAYPLAMQQARYNFTSIPIFPKFGDCFLDYSPYTKMQLYVPFCGTIDIDAADFMGRNLSVEMVIDFITGTVTAYVLANQLVVTSLTGTCAIDIPITGTEQATVNSAYESAAISERQARKNEIMQTVGVFTHPIKTVTKPLTTSAERVSTALDRAQREYELTHINIPLRQIGNASPLNSWALEFVCRLIIYYPDGECITFNATNEPSLITDKVESFGAVNGFATVETNTLNNYSGFTQVSDVDLSGISATDTEKEMIANLLQTGVYL